MSNESFPMFVLNRGGKEIKRGSEIALLDYVQENEIMDGEIIPA
jgi:hypothetical protein